MRDALSEQCGSEMISEMQDLSLRVNKIAETQISSYYALIDYNECARLVNIGGFQNLCSLD